VADALAHSLVNLGVLQGEDFTAGEQGCVVLTKEALAVYFRQYRRRMQAPFRDREGKSTCFRRELQAQAAHLRRVVLGEEPFRPCVPPGGGPDRGTAQAGTARTRSRGRAERAGSSGPEHGSG
jgi:hypothetical protein